MNFIIPNARIKTCDEHDTNLGIYLRKLLANS